MRRLILRPGAIGDFVVSLPAMEHLCAGDPAGSYSEVWTSEANCELARFASRTRSLAATGIDTLGITGLEPRPGLVETLRGFDSIVSWYGAGREEFRAALAGLPVTFHTALPVQGCDCHAVDFYLRQVGAPAGGVPRLEMERCVQRRVVIHPFSGSRAKNWPVECFREVAHGLDLPVAFTAGPEEALEDAVRFGSLWELARWIAGASLYIGNDSGITHLAAATGVPVLALFGPTDPAVWAPRGQCVRVLHARLDTISPAQVLSAARTILSENSLLI